MLFSRGNSFVGVFLPPAIFLSLGCFHSPTGLVNGRLSPCPKSPNCVSSEERRKSSFIEPFACKENPADSWILLKQIILDMGGRIEKESDQYLWSTFRTSFFRFVDDVEFRMDAGNRVIHVRSASRLGYSDFGVNRKRVEAIRSQYNGSNSK
jgi:uncharacterized protein (DUF1499 family)